MNPNKTKFHLVGLDFIESIAHVFQKGFEKENRKPNGWKELTWTDESENCFYDALLRHVKGSMESKNKIDKLIHLASVAANAYIIWWHNNEFSN